jgi:hypothetical protein
MTDKEQLSTRPKIMEIPAQVNHHLLRLPGEYYKLTIKSK